MKRVSVTGHTEGIGSKMFFHFLSKGFRMQGFSRRNGFDISKTSNRQKIIELSKDSDIFINNAYSFSHKENYQLILFEELFDSWKNTDKIIVNISSAAGDFPDPSNIYNTNKSELDRRCNQLGSQKHSVHVVNIKPAWVDVDRVSSINDPKLTTDSLNEILDFVINFRNKGRISSITVYPNLDVDSPSKSVL